jgi:phosphotriesterase-related protein
VHVTTHCTQPGAHVAQLKLLESEGVDPHRVVLGHTGAALVNEPQSVRECMRRGATFLPTNLRVDIGGEFWQDFVKAVVRLFEEGFGDRLVLGQDWAFETEQTSTVLVPCTFMPPPPYVYIFEVALPRFRKLGLTEEMIRQMMETNPQRLAPIRGT